MCACATCPHGSAAARHGKDALVAFLCAPHVCFRQFAKDRWHGQPSQHLSDPFHGC